MEDQDKALIDQLNALGKVKVGVMDVVTGGGRKMKITPTVSETARNFFFFLDTAALWLQRLGGALKEAPDAEAIDNAAERELRVMAGGKVD